MSMNLVTGATGHIGNVLVRTLMSQGKRVRALILPGEDCLPLKDLGIETIEGDVTQPESLQPAFAGIETVYHLAGIISILPGKNELLRRVNVQGVTNVIQACLHSGVRRLVYTSSIHALARVPHGVTIDESIPFDPNNPYGEYDRSKAEASLIVLDAAHAGLDAVIACPTGVIGPYDYRRSEMGQLILDFMENKPQLYIDGAYDFVDVRDVAEGLILLSEHGRQGETYILSGEQISVDQIIDSVQVNSGLHFPKIRVPRSWASLAARFTPIYYRLTNTRPRFTPYSIEVLGSNSVISHAKAERELGYSPRSLRDSFRDTIHWFNENRRLLTLNPSR
jgi:dihydroflavonol-4-reductase